MPAAKALPEQRAHFVGTARPLEDLCLTLSIVPKFDFLGFMMRHADEVLTRVKLLRTIWGPE